MTPERPTTTQGRVCGECGAQLPPFAPAGHCPRCLFRLSSGVALHSFEPQPVRGPVVETAPPARALIRYFGDYEILGEIAHGGMGIVYRARQISLNRPVALKMIASGQLITDAQVQRFRVEAEAAARLDHPNIVSIYEVGEHEGQHFYSMKLVEGGSLARPLESVGETPGSRDRQTRIAHRMATIAHALQHAHQRGVLHRDLKPSNILLDAGGEPHLADFGLARIDDSDSGLTRTHAVMGTPHYMSPEQAAGRVHDLTTASDLFSLGSVFYELLTGRQAFVGDTTVAVMQAVREAEPIRPRSLDPSIDADLETICLKSLEKNPARRYTSAGALAEDLDHWLTGQPISARPVRTLERGWLWARRRPALAALGFALALALFLGLAGILWQSAGRQRALIEARRTLYVAQMQAAQQAWEKGDMALARSLLRAQIPKSGEEDLRGFEWRYFGTLCEEESSHLPFSLGFVGAVRASAFSPDGALLALGNEYGELLLRQATDGTLIRTFKDHQRSVMRAEFSRDGALVLTGDHGRTARLWEVASGKERGRFLLTNESIRVVTSARLSPDASLVAAGGYPGYDVQVWDVESGRQVAIFSGPISDTRNLAFSPDGRHLAMDLGDGSISLVETDFVDPPRRLPGHHSALGQLEFSPDGQWLASSDASGVIKFWNTRDWQEEGSVQGHASQVTTLAFSPDGRWLASGCQDGLIQVWDVDSRTELRTLRGHLGWVSRLAFYPDGRRLLSTGDDGARVWNLPVPDNLPTFQRESIVDALGWDHTRFSPDSRCLATLGTEDPPRRLWQAATGRLIAALPGRSRGVAFSLDSRFFAAGDDRADLRVWDTSEGRECAAMPVGSNVVAAAFTDQELLAAVAGEEVIRRWSVNTWQALPALKGFEGGVDDLKVSPDQTLLAAWCHDGNLRLIELPAGRELPPIPVADEMPAMDFSPDSRWLALSSRSFGNTLVWDARRTRMVLEVPKGPLGWSRPAFSPDGQVIAVPGTRAKVEWWNIEEHRLVAEVSWEWAWAAGRSWAMTFSPEGRTFVICDNRGTVRLWSVPMRREVLVLTLGGSFGRVAFSPDASTLAIHSIYRNNLLLHARPLAEVEVMLRQPRDPEPSPNGAEWDSPGHSPGNTIPTNSLALKGRDL